jgi:hypothetical protein
MTQATRELSGEAIGSVAILLLHHPEPDAFARQARREGLAVLLQRHGEVLRAQHGVVPEAGFVELIFDVLGIAEKVVKFEKAFQRALVN